MRFPQSDADLHGSRVTAVSRVLHIRATRVRPRRVGFERKHARAVDQHRRQPDRPGAAACGNRPRPAPDFGAAGQARSASYPCSGALFRVRA
jgi:hypothetical protein